MIVKQTIKIYCTINDLCLFDINTLSLCNVPHEFFISIKANSRN
jgi:hypothetical protein